MFHFFNYCVILFIVEVDIMNTINRGKIFGFKDEYTIYELCTRKGNAYHLCLPNNDVSVYTMYLGFPTKDTNEEPTYELKNEIENVYDMLYKLNTTSIYVFQDLDYKKLAEAANDNDNLLYNQLLQNVHDVTRDAYNLLNHGDKAFVDQTIHAIKQGPADIKFINWLDLKLNGYLEGIKLDTIKKRYNEIINDEEVQISYGNPKKEDVKVRRLTKPNDYGFMNITFIAAILLISIFLGIVIALSLINK